MSPKQKIKRREKPIRVGVVGARRGMSFANGAEFVGMKLVALCDTWKQKLEEAKKQHPNVTVYTNYDKFLEHEMDAVVLANFFHEHAPFAVKALEAGFHVMSETSACKTLGEGVALARAVEKSKKIYMLAENYCFMAYVQEMRRLYKRDEIGEVQFAECEYNHPVDVVTQYKLSPGTYHWRNWIPSTYYCTHALGPIMYVTNTRPSYINAHTIARSPKDTVRSRFVSQFDPGSSILCKMDNGSSVNIVGLSLRGHSIWYRLHGTRGLMENLRTHGNQGKLRIVHEEWDRRSGDVSEKIYSPDFPVHADLARRAGHGGGDFFTNHFFAEAIRRNRQPWLNVYRGLDMSIVGIQAWKSALNQGAPYIIPDFRKESVRKKYENEQWSPFPEDADKAPDQPLSSITGYNPPNKRCLAEARKIWREMGYLVE